VAGDGICSSNGETHVENGLRRGANAYLGKPFSPDQLVATIKRLLAHPQVAWTTLRAARVAVGLKRRARSLNRQVARELVCLPASQFDVL
jgi:DNA-binding response OmpR family regulator